MVRKPIDWTYVGVGSGLQFFEVTTLGSSHIIRHEYLAVSLAVQRC
jgi:hypothetical protein